MPSPHKSQTFTKSVRQAQYQLPGLLELCLDTITPRPKGHHDQSRSFGPQAVYMRIVTRTPNWPARGLSITRSLIFSGIYSIKEGDNS